MKRVLRALVNHNPDQRPELFKDNSSRSASVQNLSCKTAIVGSYHLSIEDTIAEGGFALVFLAKAPNGQKFALKRMFVNNEQDLEVCRREIEIMKNLKHSRNVVQIIESSIKPSGEGIYEVMILMEYCNDSLLNLMNDRLQNGFTEKEILDIFCDVCNALLDIHLNEPPIIHRDLKVENILIDNKGRYLVCDFGSATYDDHGDEFLEDSDSVDEPPPPPSRSTSLSSIDKATQPASIINKQADVVKKNDKTGQQTNVAPVDYTIEQPIRIVQSNQSNPKQKRKMVTKREQKSIAQMEEEIKKYTTLSYRAPELVDLYNNIPITVKSDIWALGCLLYKLCFFSLPFGESVLAIQNGTFTIPEDSGYSPSLHRLILYMLDINAENRPNIKQVTLLAFRLAGKQNIPKEALGEHCPDINTLNLPMTDSEFRNEIRQNSSTSSSHRSNSSSVNPHDVLLNSSNQDINKRNIVGTTNATAPITITSTSVAPVQRPRKCQKPSFIPTPPPPSLMNSVGYNQWSNNFTSSEPKEACRSVSPRPHSSTTENDDLNFGLEFDEIRRTNTGRSNEDLLMSGCDRQVLSLVSHSQSDTRLAASLNPFETSSSSSSFSINKDPQSRDIKFEMLYRPKNISNQQDSTLSGRSTSGNIINNSNEDTKLHEICDDILDSSEPHTSSGPGVFEDLADDQQSLDSSFDSDKGGDPDVYHAIEHMRFDSPELQYQTSKCETTTKTPMSLNQKSIWSMEIKDKQSVSNKGEDLNHPSLRLKPPPSSNTSRNKHNMWPSSIPRQKVTRDIQETNVIPRAKIANMDCSESETEGCDCDDGGTEPISSNLHEYSKNGLKNLATSHDRVDPLIGHNDGHRPLLDDDDSGEEGAVGFNQVDLSDSLNELPANNHDS